LALNVQTFKTRALTALVFVIVMLLGLLLNAWSFLALFTIIHFGAWFEFIKLLRKIYPSRYMYYCMAGLIYITMPVFMMLDLGLTLHIRTTGNSELVYSNLLPCAILFSIWINDTMAYLVGSFIGRTPFSKISPKKTWEGTAGGVILCIITIALLGYYIPVAKVMAVQHWAIIAALCGIFGTIGDLFESKLKRMAGVKDSGNFMPGHGGFLDRFDSLLFAVPAVWIYVYLFVN
jgi:phosphatidate cytidylyltransferase